MRTGTGPPGGGDVKRFLENPGQLGCPLDNITVFGEWLGRAGDIGLLEHIPAQQIAAHLSGDDHQRNRIHISRGDAGEQVGSTWAGGSYANTDFAGNPRIARCGMSGVLFGAHQNMVEGTADKRIIKRQIAAPG